MSMTYREDAKKNFRSAFVKYDIHENLARCVSYLKKHPTLSFIAGIVLAFFAVPIAVYVAFSIVAFVLTFVGFLIILGGILLVGFLVLTSVLATVTVIVAVLSCTSWIVYAMYQQLSRISDATVGFDETTEHDHQCKKEQSE